MKKYDYVIVGSGLFAGVLAKSAIEHNKRLSLIHIYKSIFKNCLRGSKCRGNKGRGGFYSGHERNRLAAVRRRCEN